MFIMVQFITNAKSEYTYQLTALSYDQDYFYGTVNSISANLSYK